MLPKLQTAPSIEACLQQFYDPLEIKSVLDVGAGHSGVFDKAYWERRALSKRVACDIFWIRPMEGPWEIIVPVDVHTLVDTFKPDSFDWVQCMETLEHVENPEAAILQIMQVCRVGAMVTSMGIGHHLGPEQEAIEKTNPHQAFRRQPDPEFMLDHGWQVFTNMEDCQIIGIYIKSEVSRNLLRRMTQLSEDDGEYR